MDEERIAGTFTTKLCHATAFLVMAIGCLLWSPGIRAQNVFTHSYLLMTGDPACMQVVWQTDTGVSGGRVDWGYWGQGLEYSETARPYHQNIHDRAYPLRPAQDILVWTAEICGAFPGERISYKVHVLDSDGNDIESWSNDFVLPLDPAAKHLNFYGYGDTRDCGSDFENVTHALREEVDQASDQTQLETVLLHTGDVVYNGGESAIFYSDNNWMHYFSKYDDAEHLLEWMPLMVAMGNHDFNWEDAGNYPQYFYMDFPYEQYDRSIGMVPYLDDDGNLQVPGGTRAMDDAYYSYDYGPIHVAVLNAYTDGELENLGGCYIGSGLETGKAQSRWLEQDLASSNKPWKIILMHVPINSCDCSNDSGDSASRANVEAVASANDVSLLVVGHAHYYQKTATAGITALVLGGGGATPDSDCDDPGNTCAQCFFHYARFHVVDDGHLGVDVIKVNSDGSTSVADSFTITRSAPDAVSASFVAPRDPLDYRTPVRFSCTTDGVHGSHFWDFGDGTTSTEENPLHTFPKPADSDGWHTYTVSLEVTSGDGRVLTATREVQIYNGGNLQVVVGTIDTRYALYLTPSGQSFDENRDFKLIGSDEDLFFEKIPPEEYTVTLYALGYDDWQGHATVPPGGPEMIMINPNRQSHPDATVYIGSVPRGARVTIDPDGSNPVTGTTPFYAKVCGTEYSFACSAETFTFRVQNGETSVERMGDSWYNRTFASCGRCNSQTPNAYYVDVRENSASGRGLHRRPVLRGPSDQRVVKKGSAVLRIDARPWEGLTYRWFEGESGDTSHPIVLATGALYATPPLKEAREYWVRVYDGAGTRDSRTSTVSLMSEGPRLLFAKGKKVRPGSTARLKGRAFNAEDPGENRVFFDELEARVTEVRRHHITVDVPNGLTGRVSAMVRVKVDGVWSKPKKVRVKESQ